MLRHYRRCLKLGRQGFMMMSATCCMFPSLFAPFVHAGVSVVKYEINGL